MPGDAFGKHPARPPDIAEPLLPRPWKTSGASPPRHRSTTRSKKYSRKRGNSLASLELWRNEALVLSIGRGRLSRLRLPAPGKAANVGDAGYSARTSEGREGRARLGVLREGEPKGRREERARIAGCAFRVPRAAQWRLVGMEIENRTRSFDGKSRREFLDKRCPPRALSSRARS
ncbi:hypothetical protein KM043_012299 [Ampulex compressa]|nr:hypothetical protein KM043_012299 [Ampulex compressa]